MAPADITLTYPIDMCSADSTVTTAASATTLKQPPSVILSEHLKTSTGTSWIKLNMLTYIDEGGAKRPWECVSRLTRSRSGIDAVIILPVIRSKTNAIPPSVIILKQYRPCVDKVVIEFPGGLINLDETPEAAAIRELKEETGYEVHSIEYCSPPLAIDAGMSNANAKLVVVNVIVDDQLERLKNFPDDSEYIVTKVVPVEDLYDKLQQYAEQDKYFIDAVLFHWAFGLNMAHTHQASSQALVDQTSGLGLRHTRNLRILGLSFMLAKAATIIVGMIILGNLFVHLTMNFHSWKG